MRHASLMGAADSHGRPLGATGRAALAIIAAIAMIGLAACGSTVAGGAGHPASAANSLSKASAAATGAPVRVPLCTAAQQIDRVAISLASQPTSQLHQTLPRGIIIRDAPRARALAVALCALPPMPAVVQCPADFGEQVRLVFVAGRRGFHPVLIHLSGCRNVTGAGPTRWWLRSAQFRRALSRALGSTSPLMHLRVPSSVPTP
jgi:hypothetical protein